MDDRKHQYKQQEPVACRADFIVFAMRHIDREDVTKAGRTQCGTLRLAVDVYVGIPSDFGLFGIDYYHGADIVGFMPPSSV